MILDDIRARYPAIGLAVFMMDPGQPVTLETYAVDGTVYSFVGDTVDAALAKAFPEVSVDDAESWKKAFAAQSRKLEHVLHFPGVREALADLKWPDPAEPEAPAPEASVFD